MEAKDPASGAPYYYNESTGKTQWERPGEASPTIVQTPLLPPLEDWVESVDETTGIDHRLQTPWFCYHYFILQINKYPQKKQNELPIFFDCVLNCNALSNV